MVVLLAGSRGQLGIIELLIFGTTEGWVPPWPILMSKWRNTCWVGSAAGTMPDDVEEAYVGGRTGGHAAAAFEGAALEGTALVAICTYNI